eukprot:Amastigsp_a341109_223.p2 type:complete len:218 gc:universal Amastigsp_a341109_223:693-40(-)
MRVQVANHPLVQIKHVRDGVETPSRPEDKGVLGKQRCRDDAPLEVFCFEMRVREQKEHLGELSALEKVREILHRVGSAHGDVVAKVVVRPERFDPLLHVLRDLGSNLHPQHEFVGKQRRERDEQAAVPASYVRELNPRRGERTRVHVRAPELGVQLMPGVKPGLDGVCNRVRRERIGMCSLSEESFLGLPAALASLDKSFVIRTFARVVLGRRRRRH